MTAKLKMQTAIIPADLARLLNVSAASPDASLRRPLADLVADALKASARSANTARAYQTAIGLFLQHLDAERGELLPADLRAEWRPLAEPRKEGKRTVWGFRGAAAVLRLVDAALLDGFRAWREAEGDNPNAATMRLYAARVFLSVAYRDHVLTTEQAQAMGVRPYRQRQRRDEKPVGRRLSPSEVRTLRAACDAKTIKGRRDRAILDSMLYVGLRREETASLRLSDFKQDGGRWWLVLTGKGNKTRRVKVHDALYKSLLAWTHTAGLTLGKAGCVFRSLNKGDRVTARCVNASTIGRLVAEYGARAGLASLTGENRLSAHDLRRTCARNAYDNGASLMLVQALLGHSDPKTTSHYIGALEDDDDTATDYVRY